MAAQPVPTQQPPVRVQTLPLAHPPASAEQLGRHARPLDVDCTQLCVAEHAGKPPSSAASTGAFASPGAASAPASGPGPSVEQPDGGQQTRTAIAEQPVPVQQPLVIVHTVPLAQSPASAPAQLRRQARPPGPYCTQLCVDEQTG